MEFRSETISYSKAKRKEFKNRETYLQGKLDALDNEICRGNNHFNQQLLDEYESIKTELKDIYEKKRQRSHVPFKSPLYWKTEGEKPTNYVFTLEKRNFEKRVIAQVKLENGEIISDMKQINQEIELFYSDLIETKSSGFLSTNFRENFFALVEDLDIPKLSLEESCSVSWIWPDTWWGKKCFKILSEQQIPWGGWLFQRILWNFLRPNWHSSP